MKSYDGQIQPSSAEQMHTDYHRDEDLQPDIQYDSIENLEGSIFHYIDLEGEDFDKNEDSSRS